MLLATGDASGFALRKPLAAAPGTTWRYANGTTNVLAAVLRRSLPDEALSRLLRERLLDRIGLYHAVLEPDAAGTPVLSSFMHATPREWAAFGQFLLQDGLAGERILPKAGSATCARHAGSARGGLERSMAQCRELGAQATPPLAGRHVPFVRSRGTAGQRRAEPRAGGGTAGLSRSPNTWDHAEFRPGC
jgi:CubicO group peptidase (beta-lactamase class C family)